MRYYFALITDHIRYQVREQGSILSWESAGVRWHGLAWNRLNGDERSQSRWMFILKHRVTFRRYSVEQTASSRNKALIVKSSLQSVVVALILMVIPAGCSGAALPKNFVSAPCQSPPDDRREDQCRRVARRSGPRVRSEHDPDRSSGYRNTTVRAARDELGQCALCGAQGPGSNRRQQPGAAHARRGDAWRFAREIRCGLGTIAR